MSHLVFLGSPQAAVPSLQALVKAGHSVDLVVSGADTRRGRGSKTEPTPLKKAAIEMGLQVSDNLGDVAGSGAELGIVVAYGRIIPAALLDQVPMLNVHFSLLPKWRGAAPVERAILAGDAETGVCIMRLEAGLDTGPVLSVARTNIEPQVHASELMSRLAELGAQRLIDVLEPVLSGGVGRLGPGDPQLGEPTYASKLDSEIGHIDWSAGAQEISRLVRIDRAWTTTQGERIRIWDAVIASDDALHFVDESSADAGGDPITLSSPAGTITLGKQKKPVVVTGDGLLELRRVQPPAKREMDASDWYRGARPSPQRLGD